MENEHHNSLIAEYLYGRPLYPVAPLSWLLPWWSFLCGVLASAAWQVSIHQLLRLLLGGLVTGPLLGTAWAAATRNGWRDDPPGDSPAHDSSASPLSLPYTLPGSTSAALSGRLSALGDWWQRVEPRLGRPLAQLVVSTVFALAIAAQLGPQSLVVTLASLAIAYTSGLLRPRWTRHPLILPVLPVLGAWLLGHSACAAVTPLSLLAALGLSLSAGYLCELDRSGGTASRNTIWLAVPWALVLTSVIMGMQPLAAALVALLGSLPLLLAPMLDRDTGRERYFLTVQLPMALSMIIAASALGYTP